MNLITNNEREQMLENGRKTALDGEGNHLPVVKLFTPDAAATWLLSELDPEDPDIAFGLCDLGHGFPEMGCVRLSELATVRGKCGLPVEKDAHFEAIKPLLDYAEEAQAAGRITA